MRIGVMPGRCHIRGPPGAIIPRAEHPEPDVVLKSGWMAGALGSMPKKAPAIPFLRGNPLDSRKEW